MARHFCNVPRIAASVGNFSRIFKVPSIFRPFVKVVNETALRNEIEEVTSNLTDTEIARATIAL